jgi:hypothetical protein
VTAGSVEDAFEALPIALVGVVFERETRELRVPAVESSWSRKNTRGGGGVAFGGGGSLLVSSMRRKTDVSASREAKVEKYVFSGKDAGVRLEQELLAVMSVRAVRGESRGGSRKWSTNT